MQKKASLGDLGRGAEANGYPLPTEVNGYLLSTAGMLTFPFFMGTWGSDRRAVMITPAG